MRLKKSFTLIELLVVLSILVLIGGVFSLAAKNCLDELKEQKEIQILKNTLKEKELECLLEKKKMGIKFEQTNGILTVTMADKKRGKQVEKRFKHLKMKGSNSLVLEIAPPFYAINTPIELVKKNVQIVRF